MTNLLQRLPLELREAISKIIRIDSAWSENSICRCCLLRVLQLSYLRELCCRESFCTCVSNPLDPDHWSYHTSFCRVIPATQTCHPRVVGYAFFNKKEIKKRVRE